MQVQLGRTYRTKGGISPIDHSHHESIVVTISMCNTGAKAHPWVAFIDGKIGCWNNDGTYSLGLPYMSLEENK